MAITINGTNGITFSNGTVENSTGNLTLGTAKNSTSGTYIDFTGIPSWAKRITVMFNGVSTNGTSNYLVQIGSGIIQTTSYLSGASNVSIQTANTTGATSSASGMSIYVSNASALCNGSMIINLISGYGYVTTHTIFNGANNMSNGAGSVTLSGTIDRVRITTFNGTDVFDAGTINIMYEG